MEKQLVANNAFHFRNQPISLNPTSGTIQPSTPKDQLPGVPTGFKTNYKRKVEEKEPSLSLISRQLHPEMTYILFWTK